MTPSPPLAVIPTVAETLAHPAFPTAIWNLEPDRKGLAPVAEGRGGPFNISWEIHGEGPIKVTFIMGLGGLKSAWQRQTLHFGHERRTEYSVLLIDNRGMGDSDKPLMRYSSSEMARDLADVLTHVGWLGPSAPPKRRSIHVVGLSLGGMIAQELACLHPEAISTLSLCCTAAEIENTTTFAENMALRASMLIPKSVDRSIADAARMLFNRAWLTQPDNVHLPTPGVTPNCHPPADLPFTPPIPSSSPPLKSETAAEEETYLTFRNNAMRFVAQEMHKRLDASRFGIKGFILQLVAAGWHRKTAAQLSALADAVGRDRILVMHGTDDGMISPPHGRKLIAALEPAKALVVDGMGHAPIVERWAWFNKTMEAQFAVGEKLDREVSV
ncbi:Alpha/Beta hydrolase protein [Podospora didyma]|uniref:Alpha/Beta hydrolase protein n=1 Tax=Podospora didyma TaxID=330526 RepID=A0AAE0NPM1_9PEZI|nr:Alpha/Beta hydrolase protein [Podospora didyma]